MNRDGWPKLLDAYGVCAYQGMPFASETSDHEAVSTGSSIIDLSLSSKESIAMEYVSTSPCLYSVTSPPFYSYDASRVDGLNSRGLVICHDPCDFAG